MTGKLLDGRGQIQALAEQRRGIDSSALLHRHRLIRVPCKFPEKVVLPD